jgi:hypothetical protein
MPLDWRIITCRWRTVGYQPGYFEVCCKRPERNGHRKEEILFNVVRPLSLYWETYESGILSLVDRLKPEFMAVTEEESAISAWQMFLLIYDSWLAENMPSQFFEYVCESVDSDFALHERELARKKALMYIKGTDVEDAFFYQSKWLGKQRHSKWMEKLING